MYCNFIRQKNIPKVPTDPPHLSVADLRRGARDARTLLSPKISSFSCSFWEKFGKNWSNSRLAHPPLRNPGSATAVILSFLFFLKLFHSRVISPLHEELNYQFSTIILQFIHQQRLTTDSHWTNKMCIENISLYKKLQEIFHISFHATKDHHQLIFSVWKFLPDCGVVALSPEAGQKRTKRKGIFTPNKCEIDFSLAYDFFTSTLKWT